MSGFAPVAPRRLAAEGRRTGTAAPRQPKSNTAKASPAFRISVRWFFMLHPPGPAMRVDPSFALEMRHLAVDPFGHNPMRAQGQGVAVVAACVVQVQGGFVHGGLRIITPVHGEKSLSLVAHASAQDQRQPQPHRGGCGRRRRSGAANGSRIIRSTAQPGDGPVDPCHALRPRRLAVHSCRHTLAVLEADSRTVFERCGLPPPAPGASSRPDAQQRQIGPRSHLRGRHALPGPPAVVGAVM
jgi:hypothetical protein